jgi:hypothetical protein
VRIHVVQSGGIAGLRSEHRLDTEHLPPEIGQGIAQLVQGAEFFARAPRRGSRQPDMIQYRVRIEEGDRSHEVQFDDASGDPPLLELVERVTQLARSEPHRR